MQTPLKIGVATQTRDRPLSPPAPRSGWAVFTAAPHRPTFLPGVVLALVSVLWWLAELLTGEPSWSLTPATLPAPWLHGWLMLYALFPPFIFGFLFTAAPNWLNGPKIARRDYVATGLLLGGGALLALAAPLPGMLAHALGWIWGWGALLQSVRAAAPQDKHHAGLVLVALALGALGDLLLPLWLLTGTEALPAWALSLGLWGVVTPIFLIVCHRMVPWFTSRIVANYVVVRPMAALYALFAGCLAHAALQGTGALHLTWLVDLPLAVLAFWLTARWGLRPSLPVRLLAMLHIAFVWAGTAFALFALNSLAAWQGQTGLLGLAPLHALGMGFFGSMLIGMASRVSLGHSGYALEADSATWRLFWLVQLAAAVRMAADLLPVLLPTLLPYSRALIDLSALLWLLAFAGWAWKYAPMTWRPRADGKPG